MGRGCQGEKKFALSNELQLTEETPPFSFSLLGHPAHCSRFSDISFSGSPLLKAEETSTGGRGGGGVPQQQRKAGWLALPAQNGEEIGGHVELSYVLTCPSPPSPLDFSL